MDVNSLMKRVFILISGLLVTEAHAENIANEYIVKFKAEANADFSKNGKLTNFKNKLNVLSKSGNHIKIKNSFDNLGMAHLSISSAEQLKEIQSRPDVEFIEPNSILSLDVKKSSQVFGSAPSSGDSYSQSSAGVQVKEAWGVAKPYNEGTKTIVAIIDTGLDSAHKLFADSNSIWRNSAEINGATGVDDDGNGYIDDLNGWNFISGTSNFYDDNDHGTHVSGIVLGLGQDITASSVRESRIQIMPLKFLDSSGNGTTAGAVSAMYYAVNNGAKVINNSWGGASYSRSLHEAYTYAYNQNVVVVSAAGNLSSNNDVSAMYPANFDSPNNISVLASSDSDYKASFSNYGRSSVTVAAPGIGIYSSVPGSCGGSGCHTTMSGTSMAAPFVAGLAAMVIREAPHLSSYQIKSIITGTTDKYSSLTNYVSTGGRVNAYRAIVNAQTQSSVSYWAPSYSPDYSGSSELASESPEEDSSSGGCGLVGAGNGTMLGGGGIGFSLLMILMFLPLLVVTIMKNKKKYQYAFRKILKIYSKVPLRIALAAVK